MGEVTDSDAKVALQKVAAKLDLTVDHVKAIEKARKKEAARMRIIGIVSIVGSFFVGAGAHEAFQKGGATGGHYPYAVVPFLAFTAVTKRRYVFIALASLFAMVIGYLMMNWNPQWGVAPYYGVYGRQCSR